MTGNVLDMRPESIAAAEDVELTELPGGRWRARTIGPDGSPGISAEAGTRDRAIQGLYARRGTAFDNPEDDVKFHRTWMPAAEAAQRFGVDPRTVRAWCHAGRIEHTVVRGRFFIAREAVRDAMGDPWDDQ